MHLSVANKIKPLPVARQHFYSLRPNSGDMMSGEKKNKLGADEEMPEQASALLPERGIVFISGGLTSAGRRAVVDMDRKRLTYGVNRGGGSTPYGKLPEEGAVDIPQPDIDAITALTASIWASEDDLSNMPPIYDFDVVLILSDSSDYKVIRSYGPPVGDVKKLYDYVWKLIPAR